jgi:hypothetical protein
MYTVQGSDGTTRQLRRFSPLAGALVDAIFETSPDFAGAYFLEELNFGSQPLEGAR